MESKKRLYQHLATEAEVVGAYDKLVGERVKVNGKESLFTGHAKEYQPKDEGGATEPRDDKQVVTNVEASLSWIRGQVTKLIDHELVRDNGNRNATANLIVGGVTLAENLPATFLMVLRRRLTAIRAIFDSLPTLDMAKKWERDQTQPGIWRFGPVESNKNAKKTSAVVLYQHTDKHPAQIKEVTEDVPVGVWKTTFFSGACTPARKAQLLGRLDELIVAVEEARMRANIVEVEDAEIAGKLFDFLLAE